MTHIIAILLLVGQFEVAVATSGGYFVGAYPDTAVGVTQFIGEIRGALENEAGRFYPCVAYDGPVRDLLQSQLAERIGVVEKLRTSLADPGVTDAPWIVREDRMKKYLAGQPATTVDAKLVEKMCLSLLPRDYKRLYPGKAGITEFYRR